MCASITTLFEYRHRSIVSNSRFVMRNKPTLILYNIVLYGYHINFGVPEVLTMPENQEAVKLKLLSVCSTPESLDYSSDSDSPVPSSNLLSIRCLCASGRRPNPFQPTHVLHLLLYQSYHCLLRIPHPLAPSSPEQPLDVTVNEKVPKELLHLLSSAGINPDHCSPHSKCVLESCNYFWFSFAG